MGTFGLWLCAGGQLGTSGRSSNGEANDGLLAADPRDRLVGEAAIGNRLGSHTTSHR